MRPEGGELESSGKSNEEEAGLPRFYSTRTTSRRSTPGDITGFFVAAEILSLPLVNTATGKKLSSVLATFAFHPGFS